MKTNLLTIFFLFLGSFSVFAQDDVSKYFDDGGASNRRHQVKTSLTAMINGDWAINYQYKFTDRFCLEVGAGKTTPTFKIDVAQLSVYVANEINDINSGGISYSFNPKFIISGSDQFNFTIGLKHRYRSYSNVFETLVIKNYTYYSTAEYIVMDRIVFEIAAGQGVSVIDLKNGDRFLNIAFPIDFKVGYTF